MRTNGKFISAGSNIFCKNNMQNSPTGNRLFGKKVSGPFTIPSGIVATDASVLEKVANEIPEIGILTTKSIGTEHREGNGEPIIAHYSPFSFINAVGLANPGAEVFKRKLSKIRVPDDKFMLVSVFGSDEAGFRSTSERLLDHADGFELNISCPHSDRYGQVVGHDLELVENVTRSVASLGKPVFVKISPNLGVKETAGCIARGGASGITAINRCLNSCLADWWLPGLTKSCS